MSKSKDKTFVMIYRSVLDNELWKDKPFAKGQAWIDLLLLVFWEDSEEPIDGEMEVTKRGSRWFGKQELADRWGWSRNRASRFLKSLEVRHMIEQRVTHRGTLISIVNWDTYQHSNVSKRSSNEASNGATSEATDEASNGALINNTNNLNNLNKGKEISSKSNTKAKYKDWNEDWKYTDSRGNVYDWGYMVRNFGDNAENMARIIVDEDRKSRS